ncbi:MAG TPA: 3-hydroxyacyl-CoA dehydrogenase NAD-binding domain-containing protein, partial [Negativicutes bacterium]|nr:3-hydroxyacyl-CoA dehydrogenase NAD-binding domain-containing protein [Negativicutes bacterium]
MYDIKKAAVLGSGVMGGAIAAHLANAGLLVTLLDIAPGSLTPEEEAKGLTLQDKTVRNRIVNLARDKMANARAMQLYTPGFIKRITFGNLEDDLGLLREADWVIEA